MDGKTQKALDRIQTMERGLAESQAERAIGLTAVVLHQKGLPVTTQALVSALLSEVQGHKPAHIQRLQYEAAARLLGWKSAQPE